MAPWPLYLIKPIKDSVNVVFADEKQWHYIVAIKKKYIYSAIG